MEYTSLLLGIFASIISIIAGVISIHNSRVLKSNGITMKALIKQKAKGNNISQSVGNQSTK